MRVEKGFSLIELMLVIGILGILVAIALPNMNSYMDKRKVINAAESIYSQLVYARSEAIARSSNVTVNITTNPADAQDWALGVGTDAACDPTHIIGDAAPCTLSVSGTPVLKRIVSTDYPGVSILTTTNQVTFDPVRGTVGVGQNGTVRIGLLRDGNVLYELDVFVGVIGRVRMCTPAVGSVGGYAACA